MRALAGITVLDLSRRFPGAVSAMFLGDFGADVIKVDPPNPWYEHPTLDTSSERFAAHLAIDRNKKSIILDLKKKPGLEVFYRLVRKADVLVEGYRPGVMKKLKADYETLRILNPRLVYCSLSGYGQDGPYSGLPGHDMNYIALGGILSMIGPAGGPPCLPGNLIADVAGAGLHGVIGILLALRARDQTGKGQYVDIGYLDGAMSLLAYEASYFFMTGHSPQRGKEFLTGGVPWAAVYRCKDGKYLTTAAFEPHLWANLCQALGREDLIEYHEKPMDQQGEAFKALAEVFESRSRDEWFALLKESEACVAPVNELDEAFEDPQVIHRKMVVEKEHPRLGRVRQLGIPIKLSETPGEISSLGVVSGTDTKEVLAGLGYTDEEIESLCQSGAASDTSIT